jgi:hypothetical protein
MSAQDSGPKMSSATKDVLAKVQRMVPPMLEKFHKGLFVAIAINCKRVARLTQEQANWAESPSSVAVRTTQAHLIFRPWPAQDWALIWYDTL